MSRFSGVFSEIGRGGWSTPAKAVYIAPRQTQSLLSGEKLSTSNLIWLCVQRFSLTLENCSWRLALFFFFWSQAPECSSCFLSVKGKCKLSVSVYVRLLSNYLNLDLCTKCGLIALCLCFLINTTTSNNETVNQNEITLIDDSLKGDI